MNDTPGWSIKPVAQQTRLPQTCILCGELGPEVRHELIRWRTGPSRYGSGPRCADRDACWERAMAIGEDWLVADDRPMRRDTIEREDIPRAMTAEPVEELLDFGQAPEDAS
jgi:hypothetical protein